MKIKAWFRVITIIGPILRRIRDKARERRREKDYGSQSLGINRKTRFTVRSKVL